MTNRPKAIGTAGETAVVRYVRDNGFDGAERIALHGIADEGDVSFGPGVMAEVKAGKAAETASDAQIAAWLDDTERERLARGADVAVLVLKRKGKGAANAGRWWAVLPGWTYAALAVGFYDLDTAANPARYLSDLPAVRITLADAVTLLRRAGYGTELSDKEAA